VRMQRSAFTACLLGGSLLIGSHVRAEERTTKPYPGVAHIHRTDQAQDYHLLILAPRAMEVVGTDPDQAWSVVSEFAKKVGAQIAINANFFTKTESCGVTDVEAQAKGLVAAVSGRPRLVENGKPSPTVERFASIRHPRTALGLKEDGTLVILVADGRREAALGFTGPEMSEIFIREGVVDALNLDGGGSTTLYIEAEGGLQNKPSDGRERVVVNQLGFRLRPSKGERKP
jgi:exopolysaccharide biosynthesis protein